MLKVDKQSIVPCTTYNCDTHENNVTLTFWIPALFRWQNTEFPFFPVFQGPM